MSPSEEIRSLVDGFTSIGAEERVLELLRDLDDAQLDDLLSDADFADELFDSLENHAHHPHRAELSILLSKHRLGAFSLQSKANLIHALVGVGQERAIAEALLNTGGQELTELKNRINAFWDDRDFDHTVTRGIHSDELRATVLDHIHTEAAKVVGPEVKVLTDVDDTAFSSIHDPDYPRGTLYPGVLAFWKALDEGPGERPFSLGDLVFVTARPGTNLGIVERNLIAKLRKIGVGEHSVLIGGFGHIFTHDSMAKLKVRNIRRFHNLFGEYRLVFVGDSGQGDLKAAIKLRRKIPQALVAAFIHDVSGIDATERAELAANRIWVFDSYPGAAAIAHQQGLISADGLSWVLESARNEQAQIDWDSPEQQHRADATFNRDLVAAHAQLAT
jgi:hypothetical protein